ncbi:MAG: alpha-amylase family glycosyl hydrolase [Patescibacteria group bacterium]
MEKKVPWYKNSVVYQIYPWSFKDSNGDGIGDIQGIIEKLDYLNDGTEKSLGVGAIWLSPIYKSPMKDYGYDISDFYAIDSRFGTMEDFYDMTVEAHRRGIRVIMDFVTSHTSSEHPWFTESRSSKNNPKRDWYVWRNPKPDGSPPNNWISVFGGPAWTYDEFTGQYYLHHFLKDQPDLNWRNPEVREEMKRILDFWMHRGVDGFRVDAISHFIEDAEFRDNPLNESYREGKDHPYSKYLHKYSKDQPELKEVVELLCDTLDNHEEKFVVSEAHLGVKDLVNVYKYSQKKIHAPFNFNLINMRWSAHAYKKFIDSFDALLGEDEIPTYVLGNHDQPRLASRVDSKRARTLAMLLLTVKGMPFIYYGEELGLKSVKIPQHKLKDAFSIQTSKKHSSRDPERTPMQWNEEKYAGFSYAEPWLPLSRTYKENNVEKQQKDSTSMFSLYSKLIHFRNNSQALIEGSYKSLSTVSKKVYAYIREYKDEKILTILNFSKDSVTESFDFSKAEIICSTYMDTKKKQKLDGEGLTLRPYEGYIIKIS